LLRQINEGLAELSIRAVSSVWTEALPVLATGAPTERLGWGPLMVAGTRRRLHAYLRELAPVLPVLAGPDRPEELQEITRALTDVERWWP
jgi:hypothetical protein